MTLTAEPFSWQIVDQETNEVRRFYGDGAALVATGTRAPHGFWHKHPLIAEAHETSVAEGEATVRIFLAKLDVPEVPDTPRPDRLADMRLVGEWKTDAAFWAAHPWVEHVEVAQLIGDEPDGDCWTAALWLKG